MSLYVYRRQGSDGARALADALGGRRWRDQRSPLSTKVRPNDVVISWGEEFTPPAGVRVLNGAPIRNKFTDAQLLMQAGVPTIQVSRTRPATTTTRTIPAGADPALTQWTRAAELAKDFIEDGDFEGNVPRTAPRLRGVDEFITALTTLRQTLATPVPTSRTETVQGVDGEWIGRSNSHVGGNDLLAGTGSDYFARKENIVREYRVHSFLGRSIRAGQKQLREGWTAATTAAPFNPGRQIAHPWIRSWDGGWRIVYDGVSVRNAHRDLAQQALNALNLDFGAVDIGETADGRLIVLEVNRAPGIEGGTVTNYANAIQNWMNGTWTSDFTRTTRQGRRRPTR